MVTWTAVVRGDRTSPCRWRLAALLSQPLNKFLCRPWGEDLISLRRVIKAARFKLLHETDSVHPSKMINQDIKPATPQTRWVEQRVRHASTSAANSVTPRKRIGPSAQTRLAVARRRRSHDAKTSHPAASATATCRASKFPKPLAINSAILGVRSPPSANHGDSRSHRFTRAARHGSGFLEFSTRKAADRTNASASDSAAIRAKTASDSSRIRG